MRVPGLCVILAFELLVTGETRGGVVRWHVIDRFDVAGLTTEFRAMAFSGDERLYVGGATFPTQKGVLIGYELPSGRRVWDRTYGREFGFTALAVGPDRCPVTFGSSFNGQLKHLAKFDAGGEELWSIYVDTATTASPRFVGTDAVGDIYCVLYYYHNYQALPVIKYDANGSLQWQRWRDGRMAMCVDLPGADGIVVGGADYTGSPPLSPLLWRMSSDGQDVWTATMPSEQPVADDGFRRVKFLADGSLLAAGRSGGRPVIARLDTFGAFRWAVEVPIPESWSASGFAVDDQGRSAILATGGGASLVAAYTADGIPAWQSDEWLGGATKRVSFGKDGALWAFGIAGDALLGALWSPEGELLWQRELPLSPRAIVATLVDARGTAFLGGSMWLPDGRSDMTTIRFDVHEPNPVEAEGPAESDLRIGPSPVLAGQPVMLRGRAPGCISVHDAAGRRLRQWRDATVIDWDGRDESSVMVPPGVYFVRWESNHQTATHKLVRLR